MPSPVVHSCFANDTFLQCDNELLELDLVKLFSMQTDPLMFYRVLSLMPGRKIRNIQPLFHSITGDLFFSKLLKYIKSKKLYNNKEIMSFLFGFMSHYVLDSNIHPYVFYYTGKVIKGNKDTYKYRGKHEIFETLIDNYFIKERFNKSYFEFNICEEVLIKHKPSRELVDTIDYVFIQSFFIKNMGNKYFNAIDDMRTFTKLFRNDYSGFLLKIYNILESVTPGSWHSFNALSTNQSTDNISKILNESSSLWCHPISGEAFSSSFKSLYNVSIMELSKLFSDCLEYFFRDKELPKFKKNQMFCSEKIDINNIEVFRYVGKL